VKALILAGGLGRRLRPLTISLPKPMIPFRNRPLLWHIVRELEEFGVRDIVFLLYYQPAAIQRFFGDGSALGFRARYVVAAEDNDTAGAVRNAADLIDQTCLVVSGDVLAGIDYDRLLGFHRQRRALLTMALTRAEDPGRYGNVEIDLFGRVVRFVEKPATAELISSHINTGIYVIEPALLKRIPAGRPVSFETEVFPSLVAQRADLFGVELQGYWRDLGMVDQYLESHRDALLGRWREARAAAARLKDGGECSAYGDSLVGQGCRVHPQAALCRSTLGRGCRVDCGACLEEAVLWDKVCVGERAHVRRCVIASGSVIGEETVVDELAVIGENCHIGRRCRVGRGVRLGPGTVVSDRTVLAVEQP